MQRSERESVDFTLVNLETDSTFYRFAFGACGSTILGVYADSVEDALEIAAGWLAQNAPGLIVTHDSAECAELWQEAKRALGVHSDLDAEDWDEYARNNAEIVDHTYTEAGYIPSWEWWVDECEDPIPHRLTAGEFPSREVFDTLFWLASNDENRFEFRNDPRVGTDALTADQLWDELHKAVAEGDAWHASVACEDPAENGDCCGNCDACTDLPYPVDQWCEDPTDDGEPCGECATCQEWADRTDQWASSVLGVLGLEWI